ncbi:hypothetical protein LAD77_29920 [Klebsiella pneumoniae]|nr:hypothetical protein [Klebsiella pneumoniae]
MDLHLEWQDTVLLRQPSRDTAPRVRAGSCAHLAGPSHYGDHLTTLDPRARAARGLNASRVPYYTTAAPQRRAHPGAQHSPAGATVQFSSTLAPWCCLVSGTAGEVPWRHHP